MIDCLILGDQIAEGLTNYVSGCIPITVPAITSKEYNDKYYKASMIVNNDWETIIISLGVNDTGGLNKTEYQLRDFRNSIKAKHVFWILPPEHMWDLRNVVHNVAMGRQDGLIDVPGWNKSYPSVWGFKDMAAKLNK
jgi:hypothetical protein